MCSILDLDEYTKRAIYLSLDSERNPHNHKHTMVRFPLLCLATSLVMVSSLTGARAAAASFSHPMALVAARQLEFVPNNLALAACYDLIQQSYGSDQLLSQDEYLDFVCVYSNTELCLSDWWQLDFELSMLYYSALPMTGGAEVDFRPDHNPPDALLAELKFLCPTINSVLHAAHPNEVPLQDFVTIVTLSPTMSPTVSPTTLPTTDIPTAMPTAVPTALPTATPTVLPTAALHEPALPTTAVPTVVPTAPPQTQDGLTQDDTTTTTMTTVTMTFSQASLGLQANQVPPESVPVEMLEAIKFMTENYYNNNGPLDHNRHNRRRLGAHSRRRHVSSSTTLELRDVVHSVSTTLVYHSSRLYADHNLVQVFYNQTLTVTVPQNFALDAQDVALDPFDSPSKQGALLALSAFADYPTLLWMLEGQDVLASMLATKEPTMAPTGGAQGEEKEKEDQDQQDEPTSLGTPKDDEDTPEGEVPHAVNSEEGKNYGPGAIVVLVFLILGLVRVVFWLAQRQYRKFANPIAESEEKPLSSTKTGTNKLSTSRDEDNVTTVSYANTQSEVGWGDGMGQSGRSLIVEEERLVEVALPPGKLGLILSTTHAGTPVVRSVKETSAVDFSK